MRKFQLLLASTLFLFLSQYVYAQPANDNCSGATALTCGVAVTGTTVGANIQAGQGCASGSAPDVWFTIVGVSGNMTASLCGGGTNYDSYLSVFSGNCGSLVCIVNNDDFCGLQSQLSWPATAGTTYYIMVHGFSTNTGNFSLLVTGAPSASFSGLSPSYCNTSANVTLTPTVGGGTFSGPGVSGNVFSPASAGVGTHTITYTNGSGACTASTSQQTVVSIPPTVNAGPDDTICAGGNMTMNASSNGATFLWSPAAGLSNPAILNPVASPSSTTTYTLTAAAPGGPGNPQPDVNVTVNNTCMAGYGQVDLAQSFIPGQNSICGASVFLTAGSGSVTIQLWTGLPNAGGTMLATGTGPGAGGANAQVAWSSVSITPGITYYLVFLVDPSMCIAGDVNNGYPNGMVYANAGYTPFTGYDYTFTTYYCPSGAGCTNTDQVTITVVQPALATFSGLDSNYCTSSSAVTLTPAVGGGTFSGPGISGNTFDPAVAGAGTHTITYTVTISGCTTSSTQTTTVLPTPDASFTGLTGPYCSNASAVTLTPTTAGGTFSGTGVSGNTFNPSTAGAGNHTVTYTIVNAGCTTSTSQNVTVDQAPDATFSGLSPTYCTNSNEVALTPVTPGGTFSGTGVSGNTFSPNVAGPGSFIVTYTVTVGNCTSTSSVSVSVTTAPDASFTGLAGPYCDNFGPVTLTPAQVGGTFSGPGVSGNTFNPSVAGLGSHVVTYVINAGGCSASSNDTVVVQPSPLASFSMNTSGSPVIVFTDASTNNPTAWSWTFGDGGTSNLQNPSHTYTVAGTYTVTLIATNGCGSDTTTQSVTINITGMPELIPGGVSIYPNPNGGLFSIRFEDMNGSAAEMEVTNAEGKIVWAKNLAAFSGMHTESVDLRHLSKGMYFLRIQAGGVVQTWKIVTE